MIDYEKIGKLSEIMGNWMDGNEEMKTLAMRLGESPGNLVNDNRQPQVNAQNMCMHMARRGRLDELIEKLHGLRPDIDLSPIGFVPPEPETPEDTESVPVNPPIRPQPGKPVPLDQQKVYISYAWGGESEAFVNQLDTAFQEKGLKIVRDKRDLGYKGSIIEFMKEIGRAGAIIVVINEKYLKSPNCMFELTEISGNHDFSDRVFPVVLSDADIYNPVSRIKYVQHWEQQITELDAAMKTVSAANLQGFREEIDSYQNIRNTISELTFILKDMNTLTPDMHRDGDFDVIYEMVQKRIGA